MKTSSTQPRAAFTLGETVVTVGIMALVGVAMTSMVLNGTILYAKNTASNLSHDEGRIAINRLVRDIHAASSTPQLGKIVAGKLAANPGAPVGSWTPYGTNKTFWAESGTGPSSGISFKKMGSINDPNGGPFEVFNDPGNKDLIKIHSLNVAPWVGMEVVFPYYGMEGTVYQVEANGAHHWNIWLEGGLHTRIKTKKDHNVVCYYMTRHAYVVENGNLNFYSTSPPPNGASWPVTVARNIVQPPNSNNFVEVRVSNSAFSPASVTIKRGERVKWIFESSGHRSATCIPPYPNAGPFDSGNRKNGDQPFYWTARNTGTYEYISAGSTMKGSVTVVAHDGSPVKPFSQPDPDYVSINLATEDDRYNNRSYSAVNTLLAGSVPVRARLSKTQ